MERPLRTSGSWALAAVGLWLALAASAARGDAEIASELVASGLASPLFVAAPVGDVRLFIVERAGKIRILDDGLVLAVPFLDISANVSVSGERGLLGLAFDPAYATSGLFYVYYTNLTGTSIVSRFQVSDDPNVVRPDSERVLLEIPQPFGNHNGGTVAFGADGMLYFSPGDGGSANDPFRAAQDGQKLLGKMLRLDVSGGPDAAAAIPQDNPFVEDPAVRDEIWAFGLRNPYRFSFDRETGDLWIADVGQGSREEIDFEPADDPGGRNYGWRVMEGSLCNRADPPPAPVCNDPTLTLPISEYAHIFGLCSVTGGNVYRGANPGIQGLYFFADYCTGTIFSLDRETGERRNRSIELGAAANARFRIVGFGEDGAGELYVVHISGEVYRIRSPDPACSDGFDNDADGLIDAEDPACTDPELDSELPRNDLVVKVWPRKLVPGSHGLVLALVLGSERYDLTRGDADRVAFGPAGAAPARAPFVLDLDHDGLRDWLFLFRVRGTGIKVGDLQACLAMEIAGTPFEGCDGIETRPRRP